MSSAFPKAVLFDLDGTLLDSAPDMVAAVARMRARRGQPAMALEALRPHVSRGARAMATAAFPDIAPADVEALIPEFLDDYRAVLGRHGTPFPGIEPALAAMEAAGAQWGIVTNKPEALAVALMPGLGWDTRSAVLIGGDTLPARKPDPLPLVVAAQRMGVAPADCVYVGDDVRDIQSARAAGMRSIAALWGYRRPEDDPALWQADVMLDDPAHLAEPARWMP